MTAQRDLTADVDLDLKGLMSALWRKKWLILFLALFAGGLIFVASTITPKRYSSDAQILIKKRESVFTRIPSNDFQPNGGEFDEQAVGSQVLVLSSDDLAIKVIKTLDLENHPEFIDDAAEPGLLELAASLISPQGGQERIDLDDPAAAVVDPGVLKQFKEQLTVYAADNSRVAVVEFWSTDRKLAKLVPNTLAEQYVEFTRTATLESDRSATGFLEPEIRELREKVVAAEERVAEFRSQSDILIGNNNALLATQQLSEVSSELSRVKAERLSAEAKIDSIRAAIEDGGSIDVIPEVISSPLIQRLREREVTTKAEISELSSTLLANHPRIKALRSQLPEIDAQIRQAANNILKSLENNVSLSRKQEQALLQDVNRLKAEASRVNEAEVDLRALEREAAAQRERLESYLGRFNEAQSRQASGYVPSEARIIERAVLPADHYFPKTLPFTIVGMIAAMILSMVGVLAAELLSGRAFKPMQPVTPDLVPEKIAGETSRNEHEIAAAVAAANQSRPDPLAAPTLAPRMEDLMIDPQPAFTPPDTIANDRDIFALNFAVEAIERLGTASVAVTSPEDSTGTHVAIEVARRLAGRNKSVVVTDFTGDGLTSRTMLGKTGLPGLFDVLAGQKSLREVLFQDNRSSAHVLPSGELAQPAGVERLPQLVDALRGSYDFPVYSCGNAGMSGISKIADIGTVILVPTSGTSTDECKQLERQLKSAGYSETILVRFDTQNASAESAA